MTCSTQRAYESKVKRITLCVLAGLIAVSTFAAGQEATATSVVPNVINFSANLNDADGKPLTGINGVTFSLYRDTEGGAPLWMETQNIQCDSHGHFTVKLGSTTSQGLPSELFASGEARWLGIQVQGQIEQPRVLLLSVPYALKAADAETLGGLPASAFMTAKPVTGEHATGLRSTASQTRSGGHQPEAAILNVVTLSPYGKGGYLPMWIGGSGTTDIGNSVVSQVGSTVSVAGSLVANVGVANGLVGVNNANGYSATAGVNTNQRAPGYGVSGQSLSTQGGIGVIGYGAAFSSTFLSYAAGLYPYGVVGDQTAGINGAYTSGVLGTNDYGMGVSGENSSSYAAAGYFVNYDTTAGDLGLLAGGFPGYCTVDTSGDLACTGSKSAVVRLPNQRSVRLYAVESPENWFEDFGSGQLSEGSAKIALEPTFAQTVNTGADYRVFPVSNGDCKGLYVAEKSATGFVVRELGGGSSSVAFDYRIVARRKGYENIRLADVTERQTQIAATREQMMRTNGGKAVPLPTKISKK